MALTIITLHLLLLAANLLMVFGQFLDRTIVDLQQPLTTAFIAFGIRTAGIEVLVFLAAVLAVFGLRIVLGREGDDGCVAAAGLISYVPVTVYSLGVFAAFLLGWELEVWVLSATDATDPQIAATIQEGLPVVLQPLTTGRQVANVVSAVTFGVLQRRLCGVGARHSVLTAAAAGIVVVAGHVLAWGPPDV